MDNQQEEIDKGNLGEEFVNQVAYRSYLKYWCYPGPQDEYGDRKEVVDLMILFRDTCVLISVKNYAFKGKYNRYFRNTLEKATSQLHGAERKLFGVNDVFIQHPDRQPERFAKEKYTQVHRLIVNLGELVRFYPFHTETKNGGYVTVMDKEAFEKLIGELDTIPELLDYLAKREALLKGKSAYLMPGPEDDFDRDTAKQFYERDPGVDPEILPRLILSGTEADLLAHFLRNERQFSAKLTDSTASGLYLDLNGGWDEYVAHEQVKQKKTADRASYFVDKLVENELLRAGPEWARDMALDLLTLNRFERRIFGKSYLEFIRTNAVQGPDHVARRYQKINETAFLFLHVHPSRKIPELLTTMMEVAAAAHLIHDKYQAARLLVIGTAGLGEGFYFYYLPEIKRFPAEYEQGILEDCKTLGWFTDLQKFEYMENEYPGEDD